MKLNTRQRKVVEATEPKILCLASAAAGKALPNSTLIPTIDGEKAVGSIKVGDILFDRNGQPTKVLQIFPQGELEVFEITFSDGRVAKCSKDHLWYYLNNNDNSYVETLEEIMKKDYKSFSIPINKRIKYKSKEDTFVQNRVYDIYIRDNIELKEKDFYFYCTQSCLEFIKVVNSLGYICKYDDSNKRHKVTVDFKNKTIEIVNIKPLNYKEEMTCFLVDNDEHLFLMNDFIVTHNTRTLTERIRYLIEERKVEPKDIVAITFTNMASDEMKKRLGNICKNAFIGTIHSYGNNICLSNKVDTSDFIKSQEFDKILEKALTIPSSKYPKVKHLLIDECQDLGRLEYYFLNKIPTENIFYCGDDRQMIYGFKGASLEFLQDIFYNNEFTKYFLTENYRNAPNIIDFAEHFLSCYNSLSPHSIPMKQQDGIVEECTLLDAIDELEYSQNWGSWFILARTNKELSEIQDILCDREIPNVTFKKGDLDNLELAELMASNRVKVLTIHTSKGLENKNVIVTGAKIFNDEERRISYVAATRAQNALYWCPSFMRRKKKNEKKKMYVAGEVFQKTNQDVITF